MKKNKRFVVNCDDTVELLHSITKAAVDAEEEAALLESDYMSYLESGGTGEREPMSFEEWRKNQ